MRKTAFALTLLLSAGLGMAALAAPARSVATAATGQAASVKQEKLVIQISDRDPAKWYLALNNARNVQAALGRDTVDIEIVVYGPGIAMLEIDSEAANGVAKAIEDGVKVVACQNSMVGSKLSPADMLPNLHYALSGVVTIMHRQQQGYNYVRP